MFNRITWMLISCFLLVFTLTSSVIAESPRSEPDPTEWQALLFNTNPFLIEDWDKYYWYRLKRLEKKDDEPKWPDDQELDEIIQLVSSPQRCMVKMMIKGRKCVVNQPIYVLDTVSYWEFRREYRVRHPDGLELRLKLPGMPDDRYNDLHLQRELRVEESKNERLRIPLEGFWGRSRMVPVSAAKRDGPVTRVDHIIQIRWNKDKRRWDVRFLRHDEMSTMKFSPAMTAYEVDDELEKAPVGGWKRKQAALAEPPAENEPRKRPRLG